MNSYEFLDENEERKNKLKRLKIYNLISIGCYGMVWVLIFIIIGAQDVLTPYMVISGLVCMSNAILHMLKEETR